MNRDELVEKVAFGDSALKLSSSLGMYLSPDTIYLAQTSLVRSGKLVVEHLVRIPVPIVDDRKDPGAMTATLNTSFLTENQKLGTLIQQSMSQFKWSSKHVMVTLSHHLGLLRYFTMPAVERRFWNSAVPMEAKKYIPIPFAALSYDYQCIPLPPEAGNRARQGTLIAVTQKQNLANITAMLQSFGLTIAGLEIAPCSTLKLWQALDRSVGTGTYCQVHFDGGDVRILVADKGFPVFFREVFLGAEANVSDQRKLDLGGCIAFAQKQLAVGSVGRIAVSGSSPDLPAWKDAFSRELGLPVAVQDTAGMLGIKSGDWGGYSAIGASLRFQLRSAVTLDLGAVGRVSEDEKTVARDILLVGGVVSLWFLLMGLLSLGTYGLRAREFGALRRDRRIEEVFGKKTDGDIDDMFKKMRAQNTLTMDLCAANRVRMIDLIKDIVDVLPANAFLNKLSINRPLVAGSAAPSLNINGHVVAEDSAREQDLSFDFQRRLSSSTIVGKMFPAIKVTVQAAATGLEAGAARNAKAYNAALENRTSFILSSGK
jgi:hypothetical protein